MEVRPVVSGGLLAVRLEGSRLGRVAVLDVPTARWYPHDLREPVAGTLEPIIGDGVAAYAAGRRVYAYGAAAQRWAVLELPEGAHPRPLLSGQKASVEHDGIVHTFDPRTAQWLPPVQVATPGPEAAGTRPR